MSISQVDAILLTNNAKRYHLKTDSTFLLRPTKEAS